MGAKPKILIVDDKPANLLALDALLSSLEAEVIQASSGDEALGLALEHEFALFLLDVQMPEMDGYELAEILLSVDRSKDVPVIFVTAALRDEIYRMKGYSAGAIDYIEKPINDEMLLAKVNILLRIWVKNNALTGALEQIAEKNIELQTEVAERIKMQERLDHMAMYDALTNLPNRLLLNKEAKKCLSAAKRYQYSVGFMFVDLDGFKAVNDQHGHDIGDAVLVEMGLRMADAVRDIDMVGRCGGDEFIIVLPNCDAKPGLETVVKRVVETMSQPIESVSIDETLGASIGISVYPDDADDHVTLIKLADKAMYRAKRAGKNQYKFCNE